MSAMELRDLQERVIKNQLRTMPGVSDVNAWGGQSKQFQIRVDRALLAQLGIPSIEIVLSLGPRWFPVMLAANTHSGSED